MVDEHDAPELLPRAAGFREAEAYQVGIEPDGGITLNLVGYDGDAPQRIAAVRLTAAEADELARVLATRREMHDQDRRERQGGKSH